MRDECERSGEESTMPAPEKRRLLHAAPINVNTHLRGIGIFFRQKAPYAEGGCNGFSRDLSYFWNEVLAHLACASPIGERWAIRSLPVNNQTRP